jgi:hypothetical protein
MTQSELSRLESRRPAAGVRRVRPAVGRRPPTRCSAASSLSSLHRASTRYATRVSSLLPRSGGHSSCPSQRRQERPTQRPPAISSPAARPGVRGRLSLPTVGGAAQAHLWHRYRNLPALRRREGWPRQSAPQGGGLFTLRVALARLQSQWLRIPPNAHSAALRWVRAPRGVPPPQLFHLRAAQPLTAAVCSEPALCRLF